MCCNIYILSLGIFAKRFSWLSSFLTNKCLEKIVYTIYLIPCQLFSFSSKQLVKAYDICICFLKGWPLKVFIGNMVTTWNLLKNISLTSLFCNKMSLNFSYVLAWHNSIQIWKNNKKRIQGHVAIVITVFDHYVNKSIYILRWFNLMCFEWAIVSCMYIEYL